MICLAISSLERVDNEIPLHLRIQADIFTQVFSRSPAHNEVREAVWWKWVPAALADSLLKCKPDLEVIGQGLKPHYNSKCFLRVAPAYKNRLFSRNAIDVVSRLYGVLKIGTYFGISMF